MAEPQQVCPSEPSAARTRKDGCMGTALITGASAGLGAEFAWQLAEARHNLVLVARSEQRLEDLATSLRGAAGVRVEVLVADLATAPGRRLVVARLTNPHQPVGLLVNNAGYGQGVRFSENDLAKEQEALAVMVQAVLELSHAAAGAMKQRGRGAILNVGSVAGLMTSGTYSAHKAWVRTFTEGLARDLASNGVTATAVNPGLTHTEFHDRAGWGVNRIPEISWLSAEQVVADSLRAVRRGAVEVTPSLRYQAASALLQHLPRSVVRRLSRSF